jgi:hypothetical protein
VNRRGKYIGVAVAAISMCVALVLAELLLRFALPQTLGVWNQTRDGLILLRPSFNGYLHQFRTHVRTNALGFRDVERAPDKPAGTYRILLFGDSFMEALQVEFEESFPYLLQEGLNNLLPCRVEVINAGVSGWGTDDQVTYLARRGKNLHPDLVLIAFTLHNDVSDNFEQRYHVLEGKTLRSRPITEASLPQHASLQVRSYMVSHSHLYQLAYRAWKSRGVAQAGSQLTDYLLELMKSESGVIAENGWWITKQLLAEAHRLSKRAGAQIAVLPIPLTYQVDGRAYETLLATRKFSAQQIDPNKPQMVLFGILEEHDIPRVDLLPEFLRYANTTQGQSLYIAGDGHWNGNGHRVAASAASRQVADIIRYSGALERSCSK